MRIFDRIFGFLLLTVVMAAAGVFIVQEFGTGVAVPNWARDGGLLVGGASALYVGWQIVADGIAAWREAGGVGFILRFMRRAIVGFVRSVLAPALAALAAVSSTWNVLEKIGQSQGELAQSLATSAVMLAGAGVAIITKLPTSEPDKKS